MLLCVVLMLSLEYVSVRQEGDPVGRRPIHRRTNMKLGIMPMISKRLPSFSLSFGNYKFSAPGADRLDLTELVTSLRTPEEEEIARDLKIGKSVNISDLSRPGRNVWVITTASLPWKTGTAVNPTLRAAYLLRLTPAAKVTLMVPWVEAVDQEKVMGSHKYKNQKQQERDIRQWLRNDAGMADVANKLNVMFYKGRYHPDYGSIFPVEDLLALIPSEEADVAVLEEPEHLNWFHPETPEYWRGRFNHVVGIIHTNYLAYTQSY